MQWSLRLGEKPRWVSCEGSHRQGTCGWGEEPRVSFLAEKAFFTYVYMYTHKYTYTPDREKAFFTHVHIYVHTHTHTPPLESPTFQVLLSGTGHSEATLIGGQWL